jgi:hypothetical protein
MDHIGEAAVPLNSTDWIYNDFCTLVNPPPLPPPSHSCSAA